MQQDGVSEGADGQAILEAENGCCGPVHPPLHWHLHVHDGFSAESRHGPASFDSYWQRAHTRCETCP